MMVNKYAELKLPKFMYLPTSVPCAKLVEKWWGNVTCVSLVLSRELFAKICRAELVAIKVVLDGQLTKIIFLNMVILIS